MRVLDRHNRNFSTDVAEGILDRAVRSKTQLHVPLGLGTQGFKPCFVSHTKAYICKKFLLSLDFLFLLDQAKRKKEK
jgi:hypothetical protein